MPPETTTRATTTMAATTKAHQMGLPPPGDQDPLPCPRCDSTNTKFCYYNNYNFSQPRHFCKSCRRYWTRGGTLRDIPVGGGSRKTAKRPRSFSHTTSTTSSSSSATCFGSFSSSPAAVSSALDPIPSTPLFVSLSGSAGGPFGDVLLKPTTGLAAAAAAAGGFTSLLGHAVGPPAGGFLSLGGFGLGLGLESNGLEELGLGRNVWAFPELGYLGGDGGALGGAAAVGEGGHRGSGNTWQMGSGAENGFLSAAAAGEYFSSSAWPELAISTPGNGLK